jgi:hypothetical protein
VKTVRTLLLTLILSGFPAVRSGATVYQSDGSAASVQGLHNWALNGDTITLPAGTFTWSTPVTISKAITLQGSGIGRTVIMDGVQRWQFLTWSLVAGKASRMTGIEFRNGGRIATAAAPGGVIHVTGSNTNGSTFRMDHCKWNNLNGSLGTETVIGVLDHNEFIFAGRTLIYNHSSNWNGGSWGDGSWAAAADFGSSQFLFFEDNIFTKQPGDHYAIIDGSAGARWVFRYNIVTRGWLEAHGTESGGRKRGVRAIEIYNNTFRANNTNGILANIRSGTAVIHDNQVTGYTTNAGFYLRCHRMAFGFFPWGGADGTNQWDVNQPGGPFFTGTASGSSNLTVTISPNPNWSANQWVGYSVKRTTNLANASGPGFSEIRSNTANTLTLLRMATRYKFGKSIKLWINRGAAVPYCRQTGTIKSRSRAIPGITHAKAERTLILVRPMESSDKTSTFLMTRSRRDTRRIFIRIP